MLSKPGSKTFVVLPWPITTAVMDSLRLREHIVNAEDERDALDKFRPKTEGRYRALNLSDSVMFNVTITQHCDVEQLA